MTQIELPEHIMKTEAYQDVHNKMRAANAEYRRFVAVAKDIAKTPFLLDDYMFLAELGFKYKDNHKRFERGMYSYKIEIYAPDEGESLFSVSFYRGGEGVAALLIDRADLKSHLDIMRLSMSRVSKVLQDIVSQNGEAPTALKHKAFMDALQILSKVEL